MTHDPERAAPRALVAALWRYPVKSMQGEALDAATLGPRGLPGDRALAVVDVETGRVASAKQPRRWGHLLECHASLDAGDARTPAAVTITLPDGTRLRGDDPTVHEALSDLLGRVVRLAATPPPGALRETQRGGEYDGAPAATVRDEPMALAAPVDSFFDVAPLHLLATAALARLAARAPAATFDARRFRANILVAPAAPVDGAPRPDDGEGVDEEAWIGGSLVIGDAGARVAVIDPTPRCVVPTLATAGLPHDPEVLRAIVATTGATGRTLAPGARFRGVVGVYATTERAGTIRVGDRIHPV